jgi:hypothetical protein
MSGEGVGLDLGDFGSWPLILDLVVTSGYRFMGGIVLILSIDFLSIGHGSAIPLRCVFYSKSDTSLFQNQPAVCLDSRIIADGSTDL